MLKEVFSFFLPFLPFARYHTSAHPQYATSPAIFITIATTTTPQCVCVAELLVIYWVFMSNPREKGQIQRKGACRKKIGSFR